MQSVDQEIYRADAGVAADVAYAVGLLPRLLRGRLLDPGFDGIDVNIGPSQTEPGGAIECKVTITGDTPADRDAIKAKFPESEGWKCKNTGDKTATCTNP